MLTSVKGYYDGEGHVVLEQSPAIPAKTEMMVIFVQPSEKRMKKQFGLLEGKVNVPDDFDEPLNDFKDYM